MKVEIFTLCDAATVDAAGKLNVLGSFDRLNAATAPVVHPQCALAIEDVFRRAGFADGLFQTLLIGPDLIEGIIADKRIVIDGV